MADLMEKLIEQSKIDATTRDDDYGAGWNHGIAYFLNSIHPIVEADRERKDALVKVATKFVEDIDLSDSYSMTPQQAYINSTRKACAEFRAALAAGKGKR